MNSISNKKLHRNYLEMKPELVDPVQWQSVQKQIDSDFGEGVTKKILGNRTPMVIDDGKHQALYLVPYDWMSMVDESFGEFDIKYMGLWLGELIDDKLRLSLPILEHIAPLTESIIVVTDRSAEAFTYGRSVIKAGVATLDTSLERGQRVIVMNRKGEILGLAMLSIDAKLLKRIPNEKLVAKNLVDIGWYLRRLG